MTLGSFGWARGLILALGAVLAMFIGASLAVLPLPVAVLLLSMAALGAVLVAPWSLLWASFLVLVGFIVGPLQYVGGFSKAFWLPYLMGVLMAVRLFGDRLADRQAPGVRHEARTGGLISSPRLNHSVDERLMRAALAFAGLFAFTLLMTSLVNRVSPLQAVVAGKEYLFLWSLPAAYLLGMLRTASLRGLWPAMALWLCVQLAAVLWQRFLVAPRRGGDAPWDAVVGLFAGKANGAGGSGTMAMVSLWAASSVLMAWRAGLVRWPWAVAAGVAAIIACALAEVKIAVVLLPVLAVLVLMAPSPAEAANQKKVPTQLSALRRLFSLACAVLVSVLLLWSHQQQFTATDSVEGKSAAHYIETTLGRNLDARTWADEHGQLTRLGAVQYWWDRQTISNIPGWLVGHGVGAVRHSTVAPSPFLKGLRFDPGRSAAVILLWETGVLGLAAWVLINLSFLLLAYRLLRAEHALHEALALRAGAAAIVVTMISLPYGADWFEAPHLEVMHLLGVGWVCAVYRHRCLSMDGSPIRLNRNGSSE